MPRGTPATWRQRARTLGVKGAEMSDRDLLRKILKDTPVENKEYWLDQCDERQSVPMTVLLARAVWNFVQKPGVTDWVDATNDALES